jgi:hypothetical protein
MLVKLTPAVGAFEVTFDPVRHDDKDTHAGVGLIRQKLPDLGNSLSGAQINFGLVHLLFINITHQ